MADLKQTSRLIIEAEDMRRMVGQSLCGYGPLSDLRVDHVTETSEGYFEVVLEPIPSEQESA